MEKMKALRVYEMEEVQGRRCWPISEWKIYRGREWKEQ